MSEQQDRIRRRAAMMMQKGKVREAGLLEKLAAEVGTFRFDATRRIC